MTIEELVEQVKPLIIDYETYNLRKVEVQYIIEKIMDLQAQEEGYASFIDKIFSEQLAQIDMFPTITEYKKEEVLWKDLKFTAMADVEAMGQISLLVRLGLL